jgi:hypothetical protein
MNERHMAHAGYDIGLFYFSFFFPSWPSVPPLSTAFLFCLFYLGTLFSRSSEVSLPLRSSIGPGLCRQCSDDRKECPNGTGKSSPGFPLCPSGSLLDTDACEEPATDCLLQRCIVAGLWLHTHLDLCGGGREALYQGGKGGEREFSRCTLLSCVKTNEGGQGTSHIDDGGILLIEPFNLGIGLHRFSLMFLPLLPILSSYLAPRATCPVGRTNIRQAPVRRPKDLGLLQSREPVSPPRTSFSPSEYLVRKVLSSLEPELA